MIYMYWGGTKDHPRVDLEVTDHKAALKHAARLKLRVFHLFEDVGHKKMLGSWRQDVLGNWDWISAR